MPAPLSSRPITKQPRGHLVALITGDRPTRPCLGCVACGVRPVREAELAIPVHQAGPFAGFPVDDDERF